VTAPTGSPDASRQDIADVQLRYASGIDRRDWVLFRSCFDDGCDADYGDIGSWRSADEITEFMRQMHEPVGPTLHRITNQVVERRGDDEASARCYVDALVMSPDGETAYRVAGCYDDELVRRVDGWKIARRRFTMVHMTAEAATPTTATPGSTTSSA
jgi:3-phenylpropionate/cinnamic acid dioxygenase small subunit